MADEPQNKLEPIDDTAMSLARQMFGDIEDFSLVQKNAVEMAYLYARRFFLEDHFRQDPEVLLNCIELAQIRKNQLTLLLQRIADTQKTALQEDISYEEAVFLIAQRQRHQSVNEELEKLSKLAGRRTQALVNLSDNLHHAASGEKVEMVQLKDPVEGMIEADNRPRPVATETEDGLAPPPTPHGLEPMSQKMAPMRDEDLDA